MRRRILILAVLALVLFGAWRSHLFSNRSIPARTTPPPLTVETVNAEVKAMPVLLHAVGQAESLHSVAVRPQVTGILEQVAFTEGADVSAGQLLFKIDPAPMQAVVAEHEGALARDQATLDNALWQENRLAPLSKRDYVTAQEYENAKAAVKQGQAAIALDQAQLQQAQIQLGYTEIRSPISGRTGAVSVKAGNLVQADAAAPLVVVNQISPILVRFTVPQTQLEEVRHYQALGPVTVRLSADNLDPSADGRLVFIDNAVDPDTGTVALKARFANANGELLPGAYVDVDVQLAVEPHAVVVPQSAVQPGQDGSYVYLVRNDKALVQPVVVARDIGEQTVIAAGLKGGETVVAYPPRTLRDGLTVHAVPVSAAATAAAAQDPH